LPTAQSAQVNIWDVALMPAGIVIVEANTSPGSTSTNAMAA